MLSTPPSCLRHKPDLRYCTHHSCNKGLITPTLRRAPCWMLRTQRRTRHVTWPGKTQGPWGERVYGASHRISITTWGFQPSDAVTQQKGRCSNTAESVGGDEGKGLEKLRKEGWHLSWIWRMHRIASFLDRPLWISIFPHLLKFQKPTRRENKTSLVFKYDCSLAKRRRRLQTPIYTWDKKQTFEW